MRTTPTLVVLATGAALAGGCASAGGLSPSNTVVPAGSTWEAPAAGLRQRHYDIAEVDTIIGFVRGVRTRSDGAGTLEDELTVEIYRDGTTGRRVKRVTVRTHRVRRSGLGPGPEELGVTTPSPEARRHAEELLGDLGCSQTETEQRMTLEGPVFQAWCGEIDGTERAARGTEPDASAPELRAPRPVPTRP